MTDEYPKERSGTAHEAPSTLEERFDYRRGSAHRSDYASLGPATHKAGARRESDADAAQRAFALMDATTAFWKGARREECPYPPTSPEGKEWTARWDAQLDQALQDIKNNQEILRNIRNIRSAMDEASNTLVQVEKHIKAHNVKMRCRRARVGLEQAMPSAEGDNGDARNG